MAKPLPPSPICPTCKEVMPRIPPVFVAFNDWPIWACPNCKIIAEMKAKRWSEDVDQFRFFPLEYVLSDFRKRVERWMKDEIEIRTKW